MLGETEGHQQHHLPQQTWGFIVCDGLWVDQWHVLCCKRPLNFLMGGNVSLAWHRWNWIYPASEASKMTWTSAADWQKRNWWLFCLVQFSHILTYLMWNCTVKLSIIYFYSKINKLGVIDPGCAVGYKNWLRITFAIAPSSLEDGLDRLKSFCLRYSKPNKWYSVATSALQRVETCFCPRNKEDQLEMIQIWYEPMVYDVISTSLGNDLL
jgi:hypothetical protein